MRAGVYKEEMISVNGTDIELLDDGFMKDRHLWNPAVAEKLAELEGIRLSEPHREIIEYLRNYYDEFLISPNVKVLVQHLKDSHSGKSFDTKYLYTLFPRGPSFQGCKIAGLPKPTNCIDG